MEKVILGLSGGVDSSVAAAILKKQGYETIIVNNNPETVSTDFDIADKLYFEPLTREDVENIVNTEKPDGAIVQFGGQTAIKLTKALTEMGVNILGTQEVDMDRAEDRKEFDEAKIGNFFQTNKSYHTTKALST